MIVLKEIKRKGNIVSALVEASSESFSIKIDCVSGDILDCSCGITNNAKRARNRLMSLCVEYGNILPSEVSVVWY